MTTDPEFAAWHADRPVGARHGLALIFTFPFGIKRCASGSLDSQLPIPESRRK